MKLSSTCAACWLLGGLVAQAGAPGAPQTVELNGIAVFGGLQCAALVMDQPLTTSGRSFVLTGGEPRFGIRLLAVDASRHSVQIENGGELQTLRLHGAPDVVADEAAMEAAMAAASAPEHDGNKKADGLAAKAVNTALIPGNPGWGTLPPNPPPVRSAAAGSSPTVSSGPPATSAYISTDPSMTSSIQTGGDAPNTVAPATAVSTGGSAANPTEQAWYQASVDIENERITTEQDVLDGEMTPLPRTPLTPPGTPANLIDNLNGVYANHNADFLTQNWSQM
jgi:hypothetical protein